MPDTRMPEKPAPDMPERATPMADAQMREAAVSGTAVPESTLPESTLPETALPAIPEPVPSAAATRGSELPILWHVPLSRSMRVMWLLEEIGCDYDLRQVDFFDGSMRAGEYASLHPAGRVPVLQLGGLTLHESGAMIEYLCETRAPALMRGPGQAGRGPWLDWLHFAETLGQHLANLTQHHIVLREDWQRSPTVMKLEAARLSRALRLVETALADRDWLLGDFSGVDCAVGWSVWLARRFTPLDARPVLAAYAARCAARPAFRRCLPAPGQQVIYSRDVYEVPDV